jgi:cytochrome c oxidase subunit 3
MSNNIRSHFQAHPFHLVNPSPWPILTSGILLSLTTTGVLSLHAFEFAPKIFFLSLISLVYSMAL